MESYGSVTGDPVSLGAREWPARTVPVAGVDLLVRDMPSTATDLPPALFVHGLGGSSLNWTALGHLLADTVRGIAPDLPGFGRTPPLPGTAGIHEQADVLLELMDREFDRPIHLLGNSMGGAVAVVLAARHPERVASLTLVSPALPNPRPSSIAVWFACLSTPRLGRAVLRRSAQVPFDRRLQLSLSMIYGDHRALPPELIAAHEAELRRREAEEWNPEATLAAARSIVMSQLAPARRSLWAEAAKVRCPTLLVYGGRDRLVDARVRNRAQQAFPNARLLYLPTSGHVAQIEHPREVERAFRQLIA